MQLTRYTDYSLRVLIHLCQQPADEKISLDFLATHFNMNLHHLRKISQRLAALGWVHSTRGKNGGLSIVDDTRQLVLSQIVATLEPGTYAIDCHGIECPMAGNCGLSGILNQASQSFMDSLSRYRLCDIPALELPSARFGE